MKRGGRIIALGAVTAVLRDGRSLSGAFDAAAEGFDDPRERAFARELAFGVFRWLPRLDGILRQLMKRPLKRKDADVRGILLLGLYQLLYTRVPAHAAVSQSVALSREIGKPWSEGLINAVLRRFQREGAGILEAATKSESAAYAHPAWLIEAIRRAWPDDWQRILEADNAQAPMTLRVNARVSSREAYLERLEAAAIAAEPAPFTSHGLTLQCPREVSDLPGFADGVVSVQDAAAQLAAPLLKLKPGQRVLDACAAPGGKTAQLLESESALATLVALEKDPRRVPLLKSTLNRLGLCCSVIQGDAASPRGWWDGIPFDRILLDAPCTASGVIRRHPDIKYLRRGSDVGTLAKTQRRLLEALWPLLAQGGLVLYATCSILPQENQQQVLEFVESRSDSAPSPIESEWGQAAGPGRQILPGDYGMDGFYYALLAKR
ncbi:MAG TPA: 16S rRNA (cytosine(967)-C(5))-methyltransferase RsmB [Gammaproteobacteria bacterium]|nr:16S rRNA (cytosine(967)-C(5))-methyltransferase RsmB [Gammaproteobacteria bacterium]